MLHPGKKNALVQSDNSNRCILRIESLFGQQVIEGGFTRAQSPAQIGDAPAAVRTAAFAPRQVAHVQLFAPRQLDQIGKGLLFTIAAINVDGHKPL